MPYGMTIDDHHVPLAVRDFGGQGRAVLLLHGLGGTLDAWDLVAPELPGRVVAVDLRGHGQSGEGPWSWDAVLDDLDAVVKHLDLGNPVIVGHSLGGMTAVQWALRRPECPGIINLDGVRSAESAPENYPGMDPEARDTELAGLRTMFDAQAAAMATPVPAEHLPMFPERALVTVNGATYARPGPELLAAVRRTPAFEDTIPSLRKLTCSTLVVIPTQDPPDMPGGELTAAFRRGVRRDLTDLPDNIRVEQIEASHAMVTEQPETITQMITGFLT